jgi:D-beta-D-heptose 7-phosphate kinase/D-beta-D-heptose 1-phosphate adenosyltransferase
VTDLAQLANHVERLAEARVLCVGDLMLDHFVHGEVERISPEAPIPVLRVGRETAMLGGAGNVVRNLVSLGASCTFVSVIGGDSAGRDLATMIGKEPRVEPYLLTDPARASTIKTRFLAAGQQLLRTDWDSGAVSAAIGDDLVRAAADAVEGCAVVVLSDYGKGVVCGAVIDAVIERARALETPVVVDPKGGDFARYRGATVITPNRHELAAATGLATDGDEAVVGAARRVIDGCGIETVLVTRGRDGMSLVGAERVEHLAAQAREVFDVSGAGDTVVAAFAAALAAGLAMVDAARLANAAAGIVVGKVGTAAVYGSDLISALHRSDVLSRDAKVTAAGPAADRIARWRRQGLRIGFTNGCFDLLHPGHVSLLRQARAACDRLVVGLNSDDSAARLKGPGRPAQDEAARALVLASLEDVDLVVAFADDTPLALIERFRPDLLVKGADYALSEVVGAELVHGYGGRVLLAEIEPGHSTSGTIARVARRA